MIARTEFERVLTAVRASGITDYAHGLLNPAGTGRPRALGVDVLVTGLVLCAAHGKNMALSNVHHLLTAEVANSVQTDYRLRTGGTPISVRQVRYLFTALADALTPAARTGDEQTAEDVRLDRVANMIVGAFVPDALPRPAGYAMDGTGIASWARGKRRARRPGGADAPEDTTVDVGYSVDPDARWGYCTKTYDNRSSRIFGYEAFTLAGVPAVGQPDDSLPVLTHRLLLRPVATGVAEPGLALLDDAAAAGGSVTELLADRAWAYLTADNWMNPCRERGVELVFDLHPNDRGVHDHEGILMVDGAPHCPAMPERLIDIARPSRFTLNDLPDDADREQRADHARKAVALQEFHDAIAERRQYAFRRVAGPDQTGKERYECPAQAGRIRCDNCPLSRRLPAHLPAVAEPPAADTAPACCTQRTVTIGGEVDAKRRQRHNWGTPEWIAAYARRTYVEATYGNVKSAKTENMRRGWCFVWGRAKTTLMVAAAMAAANLRTLRKWAARTGNTHLPLCRPDPDHHGFEEVDADGNIAQAHAPPELAAAPAA